MRAFSHLGMFVLILFCFDLAVVRPAFAAPQCLNGSTSSTDFIDLFQNSLKRSDSEFKGSPLQLYSEWKMAAKNPAAADNYRLKVGVPPQKSEGFCLTCLFTKTSFFKKNNLEQIKEVVATVRLPLIKKTCIEAALKRSNGDSAAKGFFCSDSKASPKPVGPPGNDGPCIDTEIADYLTWITNQAIQCMSTPENPIDPILFLKKINNESGFSFFQVRIDNGSYQGTGLGQLTTTALTDVNTRGSSLVLETLQNSKAKSCEVFKEALKTQPRKSNDICGLTDLNRGVARSLIYSLGLFIIYREIDMNFFEKILLKYKLDEDIIKHRLGRASVLAYGPDGPSGARKDLRKVTRTDLSTTEAFNSYLNRSQYFANINKSFGELKSLANISAENECLE